MYTYTFVQKDCVIKHYDLRSLNFKNCISGISFGENNPYDTFQRVNHTQWIIYKFTQVLFLFPFGLCTYSFPFIFQSITVTFLYCILLGEIPPGNLQCLTMPQGIDWEL